VLSIVSVTVSVRHFFSFFSILLQKDTGHIIFNMLLLNNLLNHEQGNNSFALEHSKIKRESIGQRHLIHRSVSDKGYDIIYIYLPVSVFTGFINE